MTRHGIPTARYEVFRELGPALTHLRFLDYPVVIKASGLAAGKGVIVPGNKSEAERAVRQMLSERMFGAAGDEVVIEERMTGPEASVLAFTDGKALSLMPPAQDHKRAFDNDEGPNTGGMGAFAPSPLVGPELLADIRTRILEPAVAGMAAEGTPFQGVLYAGVMLTKDGPKTVEFNCRFGDPETQVILPLLSSDLYDVLEASANGSLGSCTVTWSTECAVAVVAAAPGYPGAFAKGERIAGLDEAAALPGTHIFHAGTARDASGTVLTDGGRVLTVTGIGSTLTDARARAYAGIAKISFPGMHVRRDIGAKLT